MERVGFTWFLVAQTLFMGAAIAPLAVLAAPLILKPSLGLRPMSWLPACWLLPVVGCGLLWEGGVKSHDWSVWLSVLGLLTYIVIMMVRLEALRHVRASAGRWALAIAWSVLNLLLAMWAMFICGMASGGTWL